MRERVFLHGLGQGPESWAATVRAMGTQALCPSLSRWLEEGADYPHLYQGFAQYCDGLDGPLHLCGLSLGGILALQYAAQRPERMASLTLIGARYRMPKGLLRLQNALFSLMPERSFRGAGMGKRDMMALTRSMLELDLEEELKSLRCPVLILCGGRDRANRAAAVEMKARLPHGELVILPGAGHEANVDAPEALGAVLKGFMT